MKSDSPVWRTFEHRHILPNPIDSFGVLKGPFSVPFYFIFVFLFQLTVNNIGIAGFELQISVVLEVAT